MSYLRLWLLGCWLFLRMLPEVVGQVLWICLLPVTWPYYVGRLAGDDFEDGPFFRIYDDADDELPPRRPAA